MKKGFLKISLLFLVLTLAFNTIACKNAPFPPSNDDTKYIAHRGFSNQNVDNTESAFLEASNLGFWGIETDIKITSDNKYVCNHDDTAVFEDGSKLKIATSTYEELTKKRLKGAKSDGEYICSFEKYLQICKSVNKVAVIEFKTEFTNEQIEEIFSIVEREYSLDKITVIDFDLEQIKRAKAINNSVPYQYLISVPLNSKINDAIENGINLSFNNVGLSAFPSYVKKAHAKGLEVGVWTLDDKQKIANFIYKGVDYVTSNEFYGNF